MVGVARVCQLGPCTRVWLPPPSRRRTNLFHGAPRKTQGQRDGTAPLRHLGTSLSWRGGGQYRGMQTRTWSQGLVLAKPPPRVAGHPCDGYESSTDTRKAQAREWDRRRKPGQSAY
jgi:hypothetical protein